ncbi:MAG: DUF779 domain-containing protein [Bacilli bacterium]|jgi:hypothetical protein|uniref:DUF779 domain-containing protein n=1 Tax=Ureibacillus suwonensis TaxID=313007 RepID=A0ABW0RA07_9BACL|nr:DUF779 domain-containing protein [Bacilli bacterium]
MRKVIATKVAMDMIQHLKAKHGELIFVHSEGCCDGTSPICMKKEDFYLSSQDEQIGEVMEGVPYYMHRSNLPYWQHLQMVIDVADGIGNSFSLESTENKSFIIQAKKLAE